MLNQLIITDTTTIILRLVIAGVLGSIIGVERSIHGRPAGLRTHLLVSLGSASFMILSILISTQAQQAAGEMQFFTDPARIAAQVVTGIGFLGAGVIIKEGLNVRGLTTAACLWATASIGMATGAGYFVMAFVIAAIALVGLVIFPKLESSYSKDCYFKLQIAAENSIDLKKLSDLLHQDYLEVRKQSLKKNYEKNLTEISYNLNIKHRRGSHIFLTELILSIEEAGLPLISINWVRY